MSRKTYIEVLAADGQSDVADPVIETKVWKSQNGTEILARTVSYRRGMPETVYGLIQEEVPYEKSDLAKRSSPDPADYKKTFQPMQNKQVFRVKRPTEKDKRTLAAILRTEFKVYSTIKFFD